MKTYVWSIPVRVFHWLLAIGFASAYILADFEEYRKLHFAFGALVGSLAFLRLVFGFFGPKYAHFRDFPLGIQKQLDFIRNFTDTSKTYVGHNPAASVVMLGIFVVGVFTATSGLMLYNAEYRQILPFATSEDTFEEAHEIMANLFLVLVVLHLVGLAVDAAFHPKAQTLKSMATGYKNLTADNTELNGAQKVFTAIWLAVPLLVFFLAYGLPAVEHEEPDCCPTEQHDSEHEEHEEEHE